MPNIGALNAVQAETVVTLGHYLMVKEVVWVMGEFKISEVLQKVLK